VRIARHRAVERRTTVFLTGVVCFERCDTFAEVSLAINNTGHGRENKKQAHQTNTGPFPLVCFVFSRKPTAFCHRWVLRFVRWRRSRRRGPSWCRRWGPARIALMRGKRGPKDHLVDEMQQQPRYSYAVRRFMPTAGCANHGGDDDGSFYFTCAPWGGHESPAKNETRCHHGVAD
jgi:hypothetical protein